MTPVRAALAGAALLAAGPAFAASFTLAMIPDTQVYVYGYANRANPVSPGQALFQGFPQVFGPFTQDPGILTKQTQWLADNAKSLNLKFVTQVGDVTQGTIDRNEKPVAERADMPEHNLRGQWAYAQDSFDVLKAADVPFSVTIGNHDDSEDGYNDTALWRETFGATSGYFDGLPGHLGFSPNERNSAQLIDAGHGIEILHLSLDYLETAENQQERAAFAQQIIDANKGKPTIVTTHKNVNERGEFESAGQNLLDEIVSTNDQIFLVLNGHYSSADFQPAIFGVDGSGEQFVTTKNAKGEDVYHMLANYQFGTPLASGYIRLLEFDLDNGLLDVTTVSPLGLPDRVGLTTPFGATDPFAFGTTARFSVPIDFAAVGIAPVPLPGALPLAALAFAALALAGRRRAA